MTLLLSGETVSLADRSSPLPRPPARAYHSARVKFSCDRCGQRYFSVDEPAEERRYTLPCVVCGGLLHLEGGQFPALPTDGVDPKAEPGRPQAPDATGSEPLVLAQALETPPEAPAVTRQPSPPRPELPRAATARRWPPWARAVGLVLATAVAGVLVFAGTQRLLGNPRPRPTSLPDRAGRVSRAAPEPGATVVMGPSSISSAPAQPGQGQTIPERMMAAVSVRRNELEACLLGPRQGEARPLRTGRPVVLVLTIDPGGTVTEASTDYPSIGSADTGTCLRAALRGVVLPTFEGEPIEVRLPLAMDGE